MSTFRKFKMISMTVRFEAITVKRPFVLRHNHSLDSPTNETLKLYPIVYIQEILDLDDLDKLW